MEPRKPLSEEDIKRNENIPTPTDEKTDEENTPDVDEVIDKESYTKRHHGRTHDGPADVSNPGTV